MPENPETNNPREIRQEPEQPTQEEIEAFARESGFTMGQELKVKIRNAEGLPDGEPQGGWVIDRFNPKAPSITLVKRSESGDTGFRVVNPAELREWNPTQPEGSEQAQGPKKVEEKLEKDVKAGDLEEWNKPEVPKPIEPATILEKEIKNRKDEIRFCASGFTRIKSTCCSH